FVRDQLNRGCVGLVCARMGHTPWPQGYKPYGGVRCYLSLNVGKHRPHAADKELHIFIIQGGGRGGEKRATKPFTEGQAPKIIDRLTTEVDIDSIALYASDGSRAQLAFNYVSVFEKDGNYLYEYMNFGLVGRTRMQQSVIVSRVMPKPTNMP